MLLLGPLMVAASAWTLWRGLSGDGRWFWLPVGAVGVLFFGYATLAWAVQRLIVTPAGLRSRLPMPGQTRMDFSDVAAIVVFPRVHSAAPVANHAVLVRRDVEAAASPPRGWRLKGPTARAPFVIALAAAGAWAVP